MDTTLSPPAGQLLDGRYRVESQLARGGMATVYLATDTRLDRTVALKIAHRELADDEGFVRRFIGEARSAAKLSSPNVVAVFDQGSDGNIHYLAMEYVPGLTLRALLNERGRLSPREALDIIEGVLAGLAVAHESGIVHRDVKPENVLLTTNNLVKVADFGLARAVAGAENTKAGVIIGTAAYLAPEQVSSSTSDERTDVYATGVMLFELLTGSQPHTGDTPLAVAYKHVSDTVPAPSSVVPELPPALDALVAFATSRDPDLRPADAGRFLLAVTEVRRGLPISGLHSRGQHAAPGRDQEAGPAAGPIAADPRGAHAAYPLAGSGPLGSAQHSSGPFGSGPYSSGQLSEGTSDRHASADLLADQQQGTGTASGPNSWRTTGHSPAGSAPLGTSPPGSSALAPLGMDGQPAALTPAALLPPDREANHTLIVPTSGLTADYRGGSDDYPGRPDRSYRRHREPGLQRWLFSRRTGFIAAGLAVVLVVLLAVWWVADGQYQTVPLVGGLAASTASTELKNLGFAVRTGTGEHNAMPRGEVIRATPATGSRAKSGSTVTIIESLGPERVPVPPVTGMALAAAEAALRQAGLTPGAVTQQPSTTVPAGIVTETKPVAGQSWPKNSPVAITESAGQPLPNFVGSTVDAANAQAASGGYTINPVNAAKSSAPQGTIIRQSPSPGSAISEHEIVTLYVSPGPPAVQIPDVQGMEERKAYDVLKQAGFLVTVNKQGPGHLVISYSPVGEAPQGSTITINVGFFF
jgi:eukaryotic-like serine/threonine-protein kinase